jgi:hypothetical protein
MHVTGYLVTNETCYRESRQGFIYPFPFTGFITFDYIIANNTFYGKLSEVCGTSYDAVMQDLQQKYPISSSFEGWYLIRNPEVWILSKPQGELYLILSICTSIVFFMALMMLGICIFKKIQKQNRKILAQSPYFS